jgi:hypothetical protein
MTNEVKYLENPICELRPLFKINYKKRVNIVSCCFFKMENSGHKDFTVYLNGIKHLYDFVKEEYIGFKIRLFIDLSIYNDSKIMAFLNKYKDLIQLVLYGCYQYTDNTQTYHNGYFGTFLRFFPMFNFPNNDANIVIQEDIDFLLPIKQSLKEYNRFTVRMNAIKLIVDNHIDVSILRIGKIDSFMNSVYEYAYNYKGQINTYIIAPLIVSFTPVESSILIKFIKKIEKSNEIFSYYNLIKDNKHTSNIENNFIKHKHFIYGVDEYFINNVLLKYLHKEKIGNALKSDFNFWSLFKVFFKEVVAEGLDDNGSPITQRFIPYNKLKVNQRKIIENIFDTIIVENNIKLKTPHIMNKFFVINKHIRSNNGYNIYLSIYKNYIKCSKTPEKYDFLYSQNSYKILLSKTLFGVYIFDGLFPFFTGDNTLLNLQRFNDSDISMLRKSCRT